jgi:hypothetical protein
LLGQSLTALGARSVVPATRPHYKGEKMTETTLLVLVLLFLGGSLGVVVYYDRKIVKAIAEYEKRLDEKGILKRHFSKPLS